MAKTKPAHVGVRRRRRVIETAVMTYRHKKNGKEITAVGTQHFAVQSYYRQLRGIIAEREAHGAVVHCEGLTAEYPPGVVPTPEQEEMLTEWAAQPDLIVARWRALGSDLVSQQEALPPDTAWRRVDVTAGEVHNLGALSLAPGQRGVPSGHRGDVTDAAETRAHRRATQCVPRCRRPRDGEPRWQYVARVDGRALAHPARGASGVGRARRRRASHIIPGRGSRRPSVACPTSWPSSRSRTRHYWMRW